MSEDRPAITTIVIVNYRGCNDTIECLESLLRLARQDFNVVVCDNASGDRSVERLSEWAAATPSVVPAGPPWDRIPRLRVRKTVSAVVLDEHGWPDFAGPLPFLTIVAVGRNAGFAGANNIGIQLARRNPVGRYLWLLNNDTVVAPDAYEALIDRLAEDPTIGQCGPTLVFYHQPDRVQALGGSSFRWGTARGSSIGLGSDRRHLPSPAEVEQRMDYVVGASLFIRRDVCDFIGLLDERYFLYFEELDMAVRAPRSTRVGWSQSAVVWHKEGASIGSKAQGRPSDLSLFYLTRSALWFVGRHSPVHLPSVIFVRIFLDGWRMLCRRDVRGARVIMLAFLDFLLRRTGMWRVHALGKT